MRDILSDPIYLYSPLLVALCSLVLAAVVSRWGKKDASSRIFMALLLSLTLWASLLYGMRSSQNLHTALLWEKTIPPSTLLTFILFYHFTLIHTNVGQFSKQWKLVPLSYMFLFILIILSPTALMIESMRLEHYGYAVNTRILGKIVFLAYVLLIFGGTYNFIKRYRATTSYEERNRLSYLLIGTVCVLVGMALDCFSNLPPLALWTNLLFAVICSITISRYHLLDIRIAVRTSSVYLITSSIIAIPYLLLLSIINSLSTNIDVWWIYVLVILTSAIFLRPLYTWSQRLVDKLFYRDRYDYLIALEDFIQETHDIRDLNRLSSSLVKLIGRALQASPVWLLLSTGSGDFTSVHTDSRASSPLILGHSGPLLRWLHTNKSVLNHKLLAIAPQFQAMNNNEVDILNQTQAEIIVPMMTKDDNIIGLILLGGKLSQIEYSAEDEHLIIAVARRMATELENARLYDLERTLRMDLERVNEQKTEFLHGVAHELRTPLTAILSSSEILGDEKRLDAYMRKKLASNIHHSASSMDRRVRELLDLARMQIGELSIKPLELDIVLVLNEVVSQLLVLFDNREQNLRLEIPGSLSKVMADKDKLEQVFYNLLSNANKFSPNGANVVVRLKETDSNIIIKVEDSAIPLTEEEKEKIFTPYYRGEDADERERISGLGLGLSISKKIIELHGGRLWLETKLGKGNIFALSLPVLKDNQQRVITDKESGENA